MDKLQNREFLHKIVDLLAEAKQQAMRSVNKTMVLTYFEIGRIIVEEEQGGNERATYGKYLLKEISKELTNRFGRGVSEQNLEQMQKFYRAYTISQTMSAKFKIKNSETLSRNFEKYQFLQVNTKQYYQQQLSLSQ